MNISHNEINKIIFEMGDLSIEELNRACKLVKAERKKKTADEMFEELNFKKILDTDTEILYRYKERLMGDICIHNILFSKISKLIFSYGIDIDQTCAIGIEELQAINQKCKELRLV